MQEITEELMADLVRQLIDYVYDDVKYTGHIQATELFDHWQKHTGWLVSLELGSREYPLQIAFDGSNSEFISYLEDRLHKDHLNDLEVFKGYKILIDAPHTCDNTRQFPKKHTCSVPVHDSIKPTFNEIMEIKDAEVITDWIGTIEEYNKIVDKDPRINYMIVDGNTDDDN